GGAATPRPGRRAAGASAGVRRPRPVRRRGEPVAGRRPERGQDDADPEKTGGRDEASSSPLAPRYGSTTRPGIFPAGIFPAECVSFEKNQAVASKNGGSLSSPGIFLGRILPDEFVRPLPVCPVKAVQKDRARFFDPSGGLHAKAAKRGWRDGGQIVSKEGARTTVRGPSCREESVGLPLYRPYNFKAIIVVGRCVKPRNGAPLDIGTAVKIDGAPQDRQGKPKRFKFPSDIGLCGTKVPAKRTTDANGLHPPPESGGLARSRPRGGHAGEIRGHGKE
ncbi:hypothetical protein THAOC_08453, partial [Thalassiosira oceanica]